MNVFDLYAKLTLDTTQYANNLDAAKEKANGFGGAFKAGFGAVAHMATQAMFAAGQALVGFGTQAVTVGSQFDSAMGGVAATLGKSVDEIEGEVGSVNTAFGEFNGTLREFAIFMGKNTAFSATEAAQALNYMALAGYDTQESMEMLPTVLNMAAAGAMDLARASDMVTDISAAMGLTVEEDADRIALMANEFAKAASTGNTSVEQLGDAFLKVGGIVAETNGGFITLSDGTRAAVDNIQEAEIAFTAMANAGIKGTEAGTHMRNMLLKLSSPTDKGKKAMEALGVSIFDTEGNMRSMVDIFGDLRTALDGVSQQEKLDAISKLFNARDIASAEALLAAVDQDWNAIGESILQADGAADEMAKTKLDNLTGDMTLFKSALESAYITINDKLSPTLREFVQFGTEGVQTLTNAFDEGGLEGAVEAFGEVLAKGLNQVINTLPKVIDAGGKLISSFVKGILDNTDAILDAGAEVVDILLDSIETATSGDRSKSLDLASTILDSINENAGSWIEAGYTIVSNLITGIANSVPRFIDSAVNTIITFVNGLTDPANISKLVDAGMNLLKSLGEGLIKAVPKLLAQVPVILKNLSTALKENVPIVIEGVVGLINMVIEMLPELITGIADALPMIIETLVDTLVTCLPQILNGIILLVEKIAENLPTIIDALVDAIPVIIEAIMNGWMTALPAVIQAFVQYFIAIASHLPEIIKALIDAIPMILDAIVQGFFNGLASFVEKITGFVDEVWGAVKLKIDEMIAGIVEFFEPLYEFFEPILSGISDLFSTIWEGIKLVVTEVNKEVKEDFEEKWNGLKTFIEPVVTYIRNIVGRGFELLKDRVIDPLKKMKEAVEEKFNSIKDFILGIIDEAKQWGADLINNIISGVKSKINALGDSMHEAAGTIRSFLHFSEPDVGPLSDFHTYAPDMMKLFAEGIADNAYLVTDQIEKSFDFSDAIVAPEVDYQRVYQSDTSGALSQMVALLQELVDGGMDVSLEGDASEIFRVVEKQNRVRTKATGYNSLAAAGG